MAAAWGKVIDVSSDEEDDYSRIKRCVKKESNRAIAVINDDDCIILDDDPDDEQVRFENQSGNEESDELLIVAEKGQVACRDYPHARHLCVSFPFNTYPHQKYCDMCHCYVCDSPAPCVYWGSGNSRDDHCHSTDKEESWRLLRQHSKQGISGVLESRCITNTVSSAVPILPEQSGSQAPTVNEHSIVLLGSRRLSGIVKWFNGTRGYGFIVPDSGEEEVFVHHSSIKSEGYRNLAEGEAVEFEVGNREDGRKQAINVTGPGGTFVRGTTVRTVGPSTIGVSCYNCGEVGHFRRNCSYTTDPKTSDNVVNAERLNGIVKWYNKQRGIGFITPDNGGKDIFVKKSSINKRYKTLTEGEEVGFQIGSGEDGRRMAIDVGEVNNTYHLATNDEEQTSSDQMLKNTLEKVSKLKLPPHIKLFLWKLIKGGLPIGTSLEHVEGKGDLSCPRCGVKEKNEVHLFFSCPWARRIWHASFLGIHTDCHGSWDLQEWGTHIVSWMWINRRIRNRALHYIPFLLHHMWKARNQTNAEMILANSVTEWMNWNEHIGIGKVSRDPSDHPNTQEKISDCWVPPNVGLMKVNFNASFDMYTGKAYGGAICKDSEGKSIGAAYKELKAGDANAIQLRAAGLAIALAQELTLDKFILEGDSKTIIEALEGGAWEESWKAEFSFEYFRELFNYFSVVKFNWCNKTANVEAYNIANWASKQSSELPDCVLSCLRPLINL